MKVNVILFGDLSRFKPDGWSGRRGTVDVPSGSTIEQLADDLGIGEEPCVVMLNDEQHHRGAELHEGDIVTFLPPIAGGAPLALSGDEPPLDGGNAVAAASPEEVVRWQQLAAEVISGDEGWRDELEDDAATPLLDWGIALAERAVARLGAAGALNEDAAYDVADAVRSLLDAAGGALRGEPWEDVEAALLPHLGPPLFETAAAGAASVAAVLDRRARPETVAPPPEPPPPEPAAPSPAATWTRIPAPAAASAPAPAAPPSSPAATAPESPRPEPGPPPAKKSGRRTAQEKRP